MRTQAQWTPSAANKRRAEKRKSSVHAGINVVGLLGIFLAILFMYLSETSPHTHAKVSVDMAKAYNAHNELGANREDAMIVAVARDGKIYFGQSQVELSDIPKQIHDYVEAGSEKKVYVRADARAKNGDVQAALKEIQAAGITNIAILTEKVDLRIPPLP